MTASGTSRFLIASHKTVAIWPMPTEPGLLSARPGTTGRWRWGRACLLYPGSSDVHLFRYRQGIIYLDAQIPDGAFDLCMPEQKLDSPEISRTPID